MLKIKLIAMGKLRDRFYAEAYGEYVKRLSAYCSFETVELTEVRLSSDSAPRAEIEAALSKEADEILARVGKRAFVAALCVEGKEMSTELLAQTVAGLPLDGYSELDFIIGSSYGLSDRVKQAADLRLSFSQMTFPHTLMRVIFAEQIYRCFKINSGGTYHK